MNSRAVLFCCVCTLCAAVFVCGSAPLSCAAQSVPEEVDLAARFHTDGQSDLLRQHVSVTRKGRRVDATVLIAPVTVRASLAGLSGRFILRLSAAPAFNIGDGMQMDLTLSDAGESRPVYSRYFDAGRKAGDREWIPIEVPLALAGSGDVYLEIKVSGGPQGDMVADWLAFAEVVIVRARGSR
jgi:hypothetical protein